MLSGCERVRALLPAYSESESTPEQALTIGRHLSDCTACLILLARERRLATMLTEDLEDFPVGEDFLQTVMDILPADPPPREERRRGLKLASFVGLGALMTVPKVGNLAWSLPALGSLPLGVQALPGSGLESLVALIGGILPLLQGFAPLLAGPASPVEFLALGGAVVGGGMLAGLIGVYATCAAAAGALTRPG